MLKNLRKKKISESGITLVALVVTIIVLLILAAVSIGTIMGNNGLIKRTEYASNTWEVAVAEEEEMLENIAAKVDELAAYVEHNGGGGSGGGTKTVTFSGGAEIQLAGTEEELTDHYGETVTSFSSVQGMDWQLCYDDDDYYYVIADDYISNPPSELVKCCATWYPDQIYPNKIAFAQATGYGTGVYSGTIMSTTPWSNGGNANIFTANNTFSNYFANRYMKWIYSEYATTKNNDNMKAVAYLLDTDVWSDFAGSEPGAYAMGGPTIELFAKSWNAVHESKIMTFNTLTNSNADASGYIISGFGTTIYDNDWNWTPDLGTTSSMWCILQNDLLDDPDGMWLASPKGNDSNANSLLVCKNGGITDSTVYTRYRRRKYRTCS